MHYWVNQFAIPPTAPGGTRHFDFSKRLNGAGVPVTVVASDLNLGTRKYMRRRGPWDLPAICEEIDGVPFHWLHTVAHKSNDWRRAAGMLRFAQATFLHLLRVPINRDTVFIGSSPTLFAALAAQKAAAIRGVRFVMEVRDLWPESLIEMTGHNGATARALQVIASHLYRRADDIVVLAKHNAEVIAGRGIAKTKLHYVPNGVDLASFAGSAGESAARLPAAPLVAVYAGAHGPANDLGTAVAAAELLAQRGEERVHVLLVGDGVKKKSLQEQAARAALQNVTFLDPVPKDAIPALFAQCQVGLLTLMDIPLFRSGVSPNKLFDYMGAGLPVLTNVEGECGGIVREAGCGWVVEPGSPAALADALSAAADEADLAPLGEAGHRYIAKHYDRQLFTEKLANLLGQGRS